MLHVAHNLDLDAVNQECAEVGGHAFGSRENNRSRHIFPAAPLDFVCSCGIRLYIDVMRSDRHAVERQSDTAGNGPGNRA